MKERHREQRALHRRVAAGLDAGHALAHQPVELPRQQRRHDVAVGRDHALRMAGGAGGVEDRGRVVGVDVGRRHRHLAHGLGQRRQRAHPLGERRRHRRGPDREHDETGNRLAAGEPLQTLGVGEQHPRPAVAQPVGHLLGLPVRVHRDGDRADRGDRVEGEHPLGVVAHRDRDAIARAHAAVVDQHVSDPAGRGPGLRVAQPLLAVDEEGPLGGARLEERAQRARCMAEQLRATPAGDALDQFVRLARAGDGPDGVGPGHRGARHGMRLRRSVGPAGRRSLRNAGPDAKRPPPESGP